MGTTPPAVPTTSACWVCGGPTTPADAIAGGAFRRCPECGFIFRPDLDDSATREIYEGGRYQSQDICASFTDIARQSERLDNAESRLRWLQPMRSHGRLLDVGAAGGAFVLVAGRAGFDAFGIEPSEDFARYAREHLGVDVRDGRIDDADISPGSVDVITLWHVLEHVPEPVAALRHMREWLGPDGLIAIEVPNIDSVMFERMGMAWTHLQPHVHVNHFNPANLALALEKAGYDVVETTTLSHGAYLTARQRLLSPGYLAHALQLRRAGLRGVSDPARHEYIRVAARRAATGP